MDGDDNGEFRLERVKYSELGVNKPWRCSKVCLTVGPPSTMPGQIKSCSTINCSVHFLRESAISVYKIFGTTKILSSKPASATIVVSNQPFKSVIENKVCVLKSIFVNVWSKIKHSLVIFTHLKWWIAVVDEHLNYSIFIWGLIADIYYIAAILLESTNARYFNQHSKTSTMLYDFIPAKFVTSYR